MTILVSGTVGKTVGKSLLALGNVVQFQDIDEKVVQDLTRLGFARQRCGDTHLNLPHPCANLELSK